jgi:hypothetical protein
MLSVMPFDVPAVPWWCYAAASAALVAACVWDLVRPGHG